MTPKSAQRPLSSEERAQLETFLKRAPSRFRNAASNTLITWAVFTLLAVVAWGILAWMGRRFLHLEYGWQATGTLWALLLLLLATLAMACFSTNHWLKSWKDARPLVHSDLAGGMATEEHLCFTDIKRFQEPEHSGLIYFLRTEDHRVFVLYDHESQQLGVDDKNPLDSSFHPQERLLLVRAPNSRFVLGKTFSGRKLPLPPPIDMTAPPRIWPETEDFCAVPWEELDHKFSA